MAASGVYPVYNNTFKIGVGTGDSVTMNTIADCEDFSISVDNGIQEWTPMDQNGWTRRLMTSKSMTITLSAKRNYGDAGNDAVAALMTANGQNSNGKFEWTLPSGAKVSFNCVINPTGFGGASTDVDKLEFDVQSDGAVTFTPAE